MLVNTTLCYLENKESFLMLHRTKKENDVNKDKWIGIGGHLEDGESPEDGIYREALEETGYALQGLRFRGIVTFIYGEITEYMHLFTASGFAGRAIDDCPEGDLAWVAKDRIFSTDPAHSLNLWAGDKIFFRLLEAGEPFFSLKLVYSQDDVLRQAALNGEDLELFDVLDENGHPTGIIQERGVCHREGDYHATVHMWILRHSAEKAAGRFSCRSEAAVRTPIPAVMTSPLPAISAPEICPFLLPSASSERSWGSRYPLRSCSLSASTRAALTIPSTARPSTTGSSAIFTSWKKM